MRILMVLILSLVFGLGDVVSGVLCFDMGLTTEIRYGTLTEHNTISTNQNAIDYLETMLLLYSPIHGRITHVPVDVELYTDAGLLGSILFMYDEKSFQWYAQKRRADGFVCGVYKMDIADAITFLRLAGGN